MRPVNKDDVFDWRDPSMPVTISGVDNLLKKPVTLVLCPEERQLMAMDDMLTSTVPNWRNDPTYNLRRKK